MEQSIEPRAQYAGAAPALTSGSAASWPAIIAGAFVAAAASLILIALGSGLGFAWVSPWSGHGMSAATFAVTTAIWLIVTQWLAAALGGYITGRLRTRWVGTHSHEVFFRDTAHGLVTWAVATVLVAAVFATSAFSAVGAGARAAAAGTAAVAAPAVSAPLGSAASPASSAYELDRLFRPGPTSASSPPANAQVPGAAADDPRAEAAHIAAVAATTGYVPDEDRHYLAAAVSARTGMAHADADKRVDDFVARILDAETKAKTAVDATRKAASQAAIYTALSMLVGAFIASISAALGGRLRDEHL